MQIIGVHHHPTRRSGSVPAVVALSVLLGANIAWSPVGFASYQPAKWLVACAGLALVGYATALSRRDSVTLPLLPLTAAFGVLVTVVLAWLLNDHPYIGFIGWVPRAMGVQAWVFLVALFVAGTLLSERISVDAFVRILSVVSVGVSATGLLQLAGVNVVQGRGIAASRLTTVFGSAASTGAWAAMVVPVLVDRVLRGERRSSIPESVATALAVVVLVGSGSRAAWLGCAFAAGIVFWRHRRRLNRRVALGAVLGVVVVLVVVVFSIGRLRRRVVSLPDAASGRWSLWSAGWGAFVDQPLVGAGPEAGRVVIPARLPLGFEARFGDVAVEDRAHNFLLDHLVATGVIGGVALLLLAVVVLRACRRSSRLAGGAGICGLLVAYTVHLVFNFVATEPDALAWLTAGLLCGWVGGGWRFRLPRPGAVAVSMLVVLLGFIGAIVSTRILIADAWVRTGIERERAELRRDASVSGGASRAGDALAAYRTATSWVSEQPTYWLELAEYAAVIGGVDVSIEAAQRAVRAGAGDPSTREALAAALVAAYFRTGRSEQLDLAVVELYPLVADDPRNASTRVLLGTALAAQGDLEQGLGELQRGTELNPANGSAWRKRAVVEDALGRCSEAAASWVRAEQLGEPRPTAGKSRCP